MSALQRMISTVGQSIQQSTVWIFDAAKRIFSPSDDDYPETGVQPFEGDISETNQQAIAGGTAVTVRGWQPIWKMQMGC